MGPSTKAPAQQNNESWARIVRGLPATGRGADRWTGRPRRSHATLLYPFPGLASSPCPFTLAARPNTIIRDLGRGVPMRGAATFLASPWGGGSDAARRAKRVVCCYHTTQHNTHTVHTYTLTRGAWRPWITLGAPRRTGVGWACLPRARRQGKKPKDETRTAIVTSSTFLASHPSAPGGSFAFGMMKCHAHCSAGREVRVTGQASDQVARCSSLIFFSSLFRP